MSAATGADGRPRLLLFFTHADHPHRDPVCATLCWLAEEAGARFECYFDSAHSGIHFGGGHPGWNDPADLRGPTVVGGRHVESLLVLLQHFSCEAACLGPTLHEPWLRASGVPIHSRAADAVTFYREVFPAMGVAIPPTLLVVGDAGRPQGIPLTPYAFPEIHNRKLVALADRDEPLVYAFAADKTVESLWLTTDRQRAWADRSCAATELSSSATPQTVAAQTAWMAERWDDGEHGFLLGDPELVGRWTPTAVRNRWLPLYGIPQVDVIDRMAAAISRTPLAHGRQYQDADFFRLSELGTAFQVIDPGSPPFPVISEVPPPPAQTWAPEPALAPVEDPTDQQLRLWAEEGRVLVTVLFWTGMIRELQSLFPLTDVLSLTGLRCGLVLTTESYRYMQGTPLSLLGVPRESGGLFPAVEPLLTDTGAGVIVAGHAPPDRFAASLEACMTGLRESLPDPRLAPRGWWAHMDAALVPCRPPRLSRFPDSPPWRIRYQPSQRGLREPPPSGAHTSRTVRSIVRDSPVKRFFAPWRPYDAYRPGPPSRRVLEAVGEAGFDYAITKSAFGPVPRVVDLPGDLTVFNQTAGRWDGWSPFVTVGALSDLRRAEHDLLRRNGPGWLVGALDTCLWAFTGPLWERGSELHALCQWVADGGSSGALVNATPATVARYARLLSDLGHAERIAAV